MTMTIRRRRSARLRQAAADHSPLVPVRLGPATLDQVNQSIAQLQLAYGAAFTIGHIGQARAAGLWLAYGFLALPARPGAQA